MSKNGQTPYDSEEEALFKDARLKKYAKNQIISYQGDALSAIYQIKTGYVKAYTILDSGDTRTMFILGPGDIFPIAFSLTLDWSDYELKYFYQSLVDVSLAMLEREQFKQLIDTNPALTAAYMDYMSASNEAMMNQLEAMKNKTAKDKILLLLPYLVDKLGQPSGSGVYKLTLKLSHQEIADLSGITRETTTALLKELEVDGVIKQQRNTWLIHLSPEDEEEKLIG